MWYTCIPWYCVLYGTCCVHGTSGGVQGGTVVWYMVQLVVLLYLYTMVVAVYPYRQLLYLPHSGMVHMPLGMPYTPCIQPVQGCTVVGTC